MPLATIAFNGTPIEDPAIGLGLDTVEGLHAITKRVRPTVVMPLVPGQRSLSVGSSVEARRARSQPHDVEITEPRDARTNPECQRPGRSADRQRHGQPVPSRPV